MLLVSMGMVVYVLRWCSDRQGVGWGAGRPRWDPRDSDCFLPTHKP